MGEKVTQGKNTLPEQLAQSTVAQYQIVSVQKKMALIAHFSYTFVLSPRNNTFKGKSFSIHLRDSFVGRTRTKAGQRQ